MQRHILFSLITAVMTISGTIASAQSGYQRVPNADARAMANSGFVSVASFPRLELVVEGSGQPKPELTQHLTNPSIIKKINAGGFKSLQVRDLNVQPASFDPATQAYKIPYAVSVKHTQNGSGDLFAILNQGTIEVAGDIIVKINSIGNLEVTVVKFDDSQAIERLGRSAGANADITLEFARVVAKPTLEGYFNSDTNRIVEILTISGASSAMPGLR